jgi:uncharacterized protein YlzI (FlbEa/FlbD family)
VNDKFFFAAKSLYIRKSLVESVAQVPDGVLVRLVSGRCHILHGAKVEDIAKEIWG